MAELLPAENYGMVRAAIDISLTSAVLSDAIIALDIFGPSAVREVLAIDPTAASRMGAELLHAQAAAAYFAAARIIVALPIVTREAGLGFSRETRTVDPAARAAELRGLASAELDAYLEDTPATADMPSMFTVARGHRGRW